MTTPPDWQVITRRGFVLVSGTVGAALLAACGSDAGNGGGAGDGLYGGSGNDPGGSTGAPSSAATSGGEGPAADAGAAVIALSDVPVEGAASAKAPNGDPLIVAQPTQGQVVAFSAVCTHQGCTVAPDEKQLLCPCHGSVFDALTGKNLNGPAPRPLDKVNVRLEGSQVVLA